MSIISVGYRIDITDAKSKIGTLLDIKDDNANKIKNEIFAGVLYGINCKGDLWDVKSTENYMREWYNKRKDTKQIMNINKLYRNKNKTILVAEIRTVGNCNFYAFLFNLHNVSTTIQKKQLHQSQFYDAIDISNDPLKVCGIAYIDEKKT